MPDIFVPLDTAGNSDFLNALYYGDIFTLWSLEFNVAEGAKWKKAGFPYFRNNFSVTDAQVGRLMQIADNNKIKRNSVKQAQSDALIRRYMKSYAARIVFGDIGYFPVWNDGDNVIQAAITALENP